MKSTFTITLAVSALLSVIALSLLGFLQWVAPAAPPCFHSSSPRSTEYFDTSCIRDRAVFAACSAGFVAKIAAGIS